MRRVLFLVVCASFSLAGLVPVMAVGPTGGWTPSVRSSAVPRSLVVQPGKPARSVRVSWLPPASSGSAVTSYRVRITPGHGLRSHGRVIIPAGTTTTTIRHLSPGRSYHVTVRAVSKAGRSPAASADYLAARRTRAWVFATDTATHSVVRVRVHGRRVRTITPSGTAWAVNAQGDVYVVDRDAQTVSRTKASGTRTRVIVTGLTDLSDVQLDAAGQVYVVAGTQVIRMSATGARQTVVADPESASVFVQPDGTVVSTAGDNESTPVRIISYPPGGGKPAVRTLSMQNIGPYSSSRVLGDRAGNLYLHWESTGGGDFSYWYRLAPSSTTGTPLYTRWANYAFTVGGDGRPYLAQTEVYCDTIAIFEGACTPDHTVAAILRYAADGTPTATAIQSFEHDQWDLSPGNALAVDRAGRFFVAEASGPSVGLREYAATGGKATVLAAGTFTDVARNN